MKRCFELAEQAKQNNESPVGSLLTDGMGNILAEGIEANKGKNDVTCHAEIEVIRNALKKLPATDLQNTVLYSTHEPCVMCSYVIRHYGICKIVYSISAGEVGGASSNFPILKTEIITRWKSPPEIINLH